MTTEEAIRTLEDGAWWDFLTNEITDVEEKPLQEALNMAITALREQEERENPTPLMLKDLMNMNGEPVWWWNKSCTPICMICVSNRFTDEPMFVNFDFKEEDCTGLTKYKWLMKRGYKPYRTNPKEESK